MYTVDKKIYCIYSKWSITLTIVFFRCGYCCGGCFSGCCDYDMRKQLNVGVGNVVVTKQKLKGRIKRKN